MIRVEFIYRTKEENLEELMDKFQLSSAEKFASVPSNIGIDMFEKRDKDYVYIILDIYYASIEDYEKRTEYERSLSEWNDIWFNKNNKHEEVSVITHKVLRRF